jgi:glutamate 5-kinase
LYTDDPHRNPKARWIPLVEDIDLSVEQMAGNTDSPEGTGGMASKIQAAKNIALCGLPTLILSGKTRGALVRAVAGEEVGTLILPKAKMWNSRQYWIVHGVPLRGRLRMDDGARVALVQKGKSLLPSGISAVEGRFTVGDAVACLDSSDTVWAKGLVNYGSDEIRRILGKKSEEIADILGYKDYDEVIHRDNLVVFAKGEG